MTLDEMVEATNLNDHTERLMLADLFDENGRRQEGLLLRSDCLVRRTSDDVLEGDEVALLETSLGETPTRELPTCPFCSVEGIESPCEHNLGYFNEVNPNSYNTWETREEEYRHPSWSIARADLLAHTDLFSEREHALFQRGVLHFLNPVAAKCFCWDFRETNWVDPDPDDPDVDITEDGSPVQEPEIDAQKGRSIYCLDSAAFVRRFSEALVEQANAAERS